MEQKISDRARLILDDYGLSNPKLERKTEIKRETWSALRNKRIRANEEHIEAIIILCPQYAYWLTTGLTLPDAGQISPPEIEKQRQNLKGVG